ncbi:hypothetical protein SBRCBS47491_004571 [Sporothrix bragantina]|uniref:Zn(2)-C6 fungal-type domain-containing protein n=1 Tax=Sporothrix bragantina TaxID=671064 RepID=A0ABP0BPJ8_9PEZI
MLYEPKACRSCAKSKRKCDKELPACLRCRSRGVVCDYPPTRPGTFAAVLDDEPVQQDLTPLSTPSTLYSSASLPSSSIAAIPSSIRPCLAWFLDANSWQVEHNEVSLSTSYCNSFLKTYVARMQDWLTTWALTGACPFIHLRLYVARFPDCLQVALTTFTAYQHRTPQNSEMILKIVEDQASKLADEIGLGSGDPAQSLSLLDQLARLHALVVYQTISLFDGDIRTRHLAESRLSLLGQWSRQLIDSARQKFSSTPALLDMTVALHFGPMDSEEHPWYLWILTESIRRTWLIANGLEAIYSMLQRGWHPCPGGVMFTTRQGVWDAASPLAWEDVCFSAGKTPEAVGFVRRFEAHRLFHDSTPDQVDEFTQLIMETTYGVERMQKWRQDNGPSRSADHGAERPSNRSLPTS